MRVSSVARRLTASVRPRRILMGRAVAKERLKFLYAPPCQAAGFQKYHGRHHSDGDAEKEGSRCRLQLDGPPGRGGETGPHIQIGLLRGNRDLLSRMHRAMGP